MLDAIRHEIKTIKDCGSAALKVARGTMWGRTYDVRRMTDKKQEDLHGQELLDSLQVHRH